MTTLTLSTLDWVVISLFILAVLTLGFSARIRDSSVLQYLVAGRNLSVAPFVATLVCTWYGGILGVGESVSFYGVGAWLLIGIPYYVFGVIYAVWLAPKVRAADQISIPERLAERWGTWSGVVSALLIFLIAAPAAHVLMLGVLIEQLTGMSRVLAVCIAAGGGIALLYKGGLLADVRVSLLAFLMMYVGFATMAFQCVTFLEPAQLPSLIENKDLTKFTGGASWTAILSFFILGAWTLVDPAFHQRVASASSPKVGRSGVLVAVGFWFLFDILSIGTALYAIALLKPFPEKLAVYPALAERVLPPGLKAVFLCGILGTVATAMVSYTLVSGATIGREVIGRLLNSPSDELIRRWIKAGLVIAMAVAVPIGLTLNSVVDLWYAWAGVAVGALLLPVLISYGARSSLGNRTVIVSMLAAATASMVWLIHGQRTNNPFLEVVFLKLPGSWTVALPPVPPALQSQAKASITFSIGTLLPGLVISAVILSIGWVAAKRNRK